LKIVGCSGIRETFVKDTTPRLKYWGLIEIV
jgi:hypothetical protein